MLKNASQSILFNGPGEILKCQWMWGVYVVISVILKENSPRGVEDSREMHDIPIYFSLG